MRGGPGAATCADPEAGQSGANGGRVALNMSMTLKTVRAIDLRYDEESLEAALRGKPRPGKQRVLDATQSQRIIAMVCGRRRQVGAVRLIAEEAMK